MREYRGRVVPVNIEEEMKSSYLDYAMSVIIGGGIVVIGEIPSVYVIDISVVVVVNPVVGNFIRVGPDVVYEVFVGIEYPCVNYPDNHVARAGMTFPYFGGVNVGISRTIILANVVQSPEIAKAWIVRQGLTGPDIEVGFQIAEAPESLQGFQKSCISYVRSCLYLVSSVDSEGLDGSNGIVTG